MLSAREQCPECYGSAVIDLRDILYSSRVDYYRCPACGCWWMVRKGQDGPATRAIFGHDDASDVKIIKAG